MHRTQLLRIGCFFFLAGVGCSASVSPPASGSGGSGTGGSGTGGAPGAGGGGGAPPGSGGSAYTEPQLVVSSPSGWWQTGLPLTEVASGTADVTVNDGSPSQTFDGFGGAFNELGWSYLMTLSQSERDRAMNLLFGKDGCHFTSGRIPIGASDYAVDRYTDDETAGDYGMASFSIDRDKQKLIPYVQAALAVNPDLHLWASAWTPPTWMKSMPYKSPANVPSAFDGGTMKSDAQTLQAYALYLARFVQEYAKAGINIEMVVPQNEPNFDQNYPSCLWANDTFTKFIGQYLGPTFAAQNITASIFLGTMSNESKDSALIKAVLADATATNYIKGFGLQWGLENHVSDVKPQNLPIWQTEHQAGNNPWESGYKSTAPNDQAYAAKSWGWIKSWITKGVNLYSAWNMVLDKAGKGIDTTRDWAQNALLVVDGGQLTLTPTFHLFRHISQFVDPGAHLVATQGGDALAFKNPDGTIVVFIFTTSAGKKMTVALGGKTLQFDMPTNGWATINWT